MPSCLKRIIALCLVLVTCFSVCAVPANASIVDSSRQFWDWVKEIPSPADWWSALWQSDETDVKNAYDDYIKKIERDLGTTEIGFGEYLYYKVPVVGASLAEPSDKCSVQCTPGEDFSVTWTCTHGYGAWKLQLYLDSFVTPFAGNYSLAFVRFGTSSYKMNGSLFVKSPTGGDTSVPNISFKAINGRKGVSADSFLGGAAYGPGITVIPEGAYALLSDNSGTYAESGYFVFGCKPAALPLYNQPETRAATLVGQLSYYGNDGKLIVAENVKLVDETNNTLYNPVTNTTSNITNWTYDYSDRSYHLTLDNGTSSSVTYGDESITIKEGDTITNIYYGGGSGTTNPPTDPDKPGGGGTTDPDKPGEDDDKDSIWAKLGELIGSFLKGILDIFTAIFSKVLDGLTAVVTMINEKLVGVVTSILGLFDSLPLLFGGFTAFLTAVFPFLPQEVFDIIILTAALVGLAFLIKFCLKR